MKHADREAWRIGRSLRCPTKREILALLASTRSPDSYLVGGAALHFRPESTRYSHDLGSFHDSSERVAKAYEADARLLAEAGHESA